jgi:hypothetical protein
MEINYIVSARYFRFTREILVFMQRGPILAGKRRRVLLRQVRNKQKSRRMAKSWENERRFISTGNKERHFIRRLFGFVSCSWYEITKERCVLMMPMSRLV